MPHLPNKSAGCPTRVVVKAEDRCERPEFLPLLDMKNGYRRESWLLWISFPFTSVSFIFTSSAEVGVCFLGGELGT